MTMMVIMREEERWLETEPSHSILVITGYYE